MEKIRYRFNSAFSLVENIVVFTVLGIIIFLVVPKIIDNNNVKNNKVILRKSVMSYEMILNDVMISNSGIRTVADLDEIISKNNCKYVKTVLAIESSDNCVFKTSDGVWWDISTPSKALMSVKSKDLLTMTEAKSTDNKTTFFVPYSINNSSVAILTGAEQTEKSALTKTTAYLINK